MFTLLVCLVVVVVSGAAVIRVTMGSAVKPATEPPTRHRQDGAPESSQEAAEGSTGADEAPAKADETSAEADESVSDTPETPAEVPAAKAKGHDDEEGQRRATGVVRPPAAVRTGQAEPRSVAASSTTYTLDRPHPGTPARPAPGRGQAQVATRREPRVRQRGWRRMRSVVLLALVLAMIGMLLALLVGLAVAVFSLGLRDAVTS